MPNATDVLSRNRVLLTHFDSYSAALFFAKWGPTLLSPTALPADASAVSPPAEVSPYHDDAAVHAAIVGLLGLNPQEVAPVADFHHWFQTPDGLVRVHLLRFNTFEPPRALLESSGATFKAISELRGSAPQELALAREVFNLIIGAGGGRA